MRTVLQQCIDTSAAVSYQQILVTISSCELPVAVQCRGRQWRWTVCVRCEHPCHDEHRNIPGRRELQDSQTTIQDLTTQHTRVYTTLQHTVYSITVRWLGAVVVRPLDSWRADRGFNSWPLHCRATTLGKLFTPMCLCSPSSIIWYLARAFMLMRLYVAAIHGSN